MTETARLHFPWSNSHPWDVDILVVGGGPAGLSAVTRLRWMKTMNPTPLSVVLVNSGPLGGLAKIGNSILTGPAIAFPAGELVTRLGKDLEAYPVPIVNQKAISVHKTGSLFTTTLEDGSSITSIAVIMGCGMIDLRNMHHFWQKGITATFGNRANIMKILRRELSKHQYPLIIGGIHLLKLQETILELNPNTKLLIDQPRQSHSEHIIWGTLQEVTAEENGMNVQIIQDSAGINLHTDQIILEFNSLELNRTSLPTGLSPDQNGYLSTSEKRGLFIAGDCCGPPFSALVALGEGAKAGLEAYQYGHEFKYGRKAPLFAYYGDDSLEDGCQNDDYQLQDGLIPARLVDHCPKQIDPTLWHQIDGATTIASLQHDMAHEQIIKLLELRAITFCPQTDHT